VLHVGFTPTSLALGLGKLWVTVRDSDEVVQIDTSTLSLNRTTGVPVPVSVITGWGSAWVLSLDSQALYRLDPEGRIYPQTIYAPVRDPIGMVSAANEVWMLGAREGGVSPVSATLGRVVRAGFDLPGRVLGGLSAADNTIWLAEPGRRALLRLDATSGAVAELPMPRKVEPSLTALGPCGVWVASRSGTIELVDRQTGLALSGPVRIGRSIAALAASGTGVWASDPLDGTVEYVAARSPLVR
jgi:streptogramin lyase